MMYECPICKQQYPLIYRLDEERSVCEDCFIDTTGVEPSSAKRIREAHARARDTRSTDLFCEMKAAEAPGVVDHGNPRETTGNGATRESNGGRGRFDLIPPYPLERLAVHYENGSKKYAPYNWTKGLPLESFINSAERHMNKFKQCDRSEDHLAAILWNVMGYMHTEREIKAGRLPANLADGAPWFDRGDE